MPTSYSIGNHLNFLSLGVRAARSYAPVLPREAEGVADEMEVMFDEITSLNAQQEKAKQTLARLTRALNEKKRESLRARPSHPSGRGHPWPARPAHQRVPSGDGREGAHGARRGEGAQGEGDR